MAPPDVNLQQPKVKGSDEYKDINSGIGLIWIIMEICSVINMKIFTCSTVMQTRTCRSGSNVVGIWDMS